MAAADAAARAAHAANKTSEQVALASAKAAALAVQTAGGSLQQGCVEAGRAALYALKSEQTTSTAVASSNVAFTALRSIGLPEDHITECLAQAVKTTCRATGTQSDALAECAGSTAMAAAQHAGMTEDEQAEVAGKAVELVIALATETTQPAEAAPSTTENPELQVLIREVEEAKKAAQDAAIAAGMAHVEAEKAKATATLPPTTSSTTTVPRNASFETEVIVTDAPQPAAA